MPENQPPESDPFADLYGRLPDPRRGARADDAPPSRRAAREARAAGGDAPEAPDLSLIHISEPTRLWY
ncbi:ABC transporter substrate-binding protein, partial [Microbacterium proteolyticum]|nr:ABC transporter substrate-binding protein [Microbacterium proteolyticum]